VNRPLRQTLIAIFFLAAWASSGAARAADSLSPYWNFYPHFDEIPCSSGSEYATGLKCQESNFQIYSREACSRDYQCIIPAVRLRHMRIELTGQCSGEECVYRPSQSRWCLHRRTPSDLPVFSYERCEHNFDCPSGQSCGRWWSKDEQRYCGYLPSTVWPPGTKFLHPGELVNTNVRPPAPLPKDFPQIWNITKGPLPPAPPGYVWVHGPELRCGYCGSLAPCTLSSPRYEATDYLIQQSFPICLKFYDEERTNRDLDEPLNFPASDFEPPSPCNTPMKARLWRLHKLKGGS